MEKIKLDSELREHYINKLNDMLPSIVKAELDTIKETEKDTHVPKLYMFSTFSMAVASLGHVDTKYIRSLEAIDGALRAFKQEEPRRLPDELREIYTAEKSKIIGLILILPSTSFIGKLTDLNDIERTMVEDLSKGKIELDDIINLKSDHPCARLKVYVQDAIQFHLLTFFSETLELYNIVYHEEEALDIVKNEKACLDLIKVRKEKDGIVEGNLLKLNQFIEVE